MKNGSFAFTQYVLMGWGVNTMGQLGTGTLQDEPLPIPILSPLLLQNSGFMGQFPLKWIVGGANTTLLIDSLNHVYLAGNYVPEIQWMTFQRLSVLTDIIQAALGWNHALAIDTLGRVWSWGENKVGQLGRSLESSNTPEMVNLPTPTIQVACGLFHSACLTKEGKVYLWGKNQKNQCGLSKHSLIVPIPQRLELGEEYDSIIELACSSDATLLRTSSNAIVIVGKGIKKIIGNSIHPFAMQVPFSMSEEEDRIEEIRATWRALILRTQKNRILRLGSFGRSISTKESILEWFSFDPPIRQLQVGSEQIMVLDTLNQVQMWGWNEHGNCGVRSEPLSHWFNSNSLDPEKPSRSSGQIPKLPDVLIPTNVDFSELMKKLPGHYELNIELIGCGYAHSFACFKIQTHEPLEI